ncbi:hypothetical protein Ct61P_15223 [Colletotrichum tofieldiae]|nr:hypothetical protein Ct61P_15223 [Colletotrichum tofieldiae]
MNLDSKDKRGKRNGKHEGVMKQKQNGLGAETPRLHDAGRCHEERNWFLFMPQQPKQLNNKT